MGRPVTRLILLACLAVYAVFATGPWWKKVQGASHARDFASYYYAAQVAADGGNPYNKASLGRAAREDHSRKSVHPFFYPPPYVLAMGWALPLELETAFRVWYGLGHLFLLSALMALWKLAPGRFTPAVLGVFAVTFTPIPDSHWMGQANLLVFALALWALWLERSGRSVWAGVLMGAAAMLKMSPALLVAWWALHGRWRAVGVSVGFAVLSTIAALPLVGPSAQWFFYSEVLPGFARGEYHGLTVPIGLLHNHSIPALLHEIWPGTRTALSTTAGAVSRITALLLLAGCAWAFRKRPLQGTDGLHQTGAVVVLMLVLPTYAYEHHMVWMLLPYTAAWVAVREGRARARWLVPLGIAYAVQAVQLAWLKELYPAIRRSGANGDALVWLLKESKFFCAVGVGLFCFIAALNRPKPVASDDTAPPLPDAPEQATG